MLIWNSLYSSSASLACPAIPTASRAARLAESPKFQQLRREPGGWLCIILFGGVDHKAYRQEFDDRPLEVFVERHEQVAELGAEAGRGGQEVGDQCRSAGWE